MMLEVEAHRRTASLLPSKSVTTNLKRWAGLLASVLRHPPDLPYARGHKWYEALSAPGDDSSPSQWRGRRGLERGALHPQTHRVPYSPST